MENSIFVITNKKEEKFLRQKATEFDFNKFTRREIVNLLNKMKKAMYAAQGVGLSANQIGLDERVFVAKVPQPQGGYKFYSIFNPKIEKASKGKVALEEGCLSVPRTYGEVERHEKVVLTGYDKNGKPVKIKAWGLLARVFQHEIDHLNGVLFIDRTKTLHKIPSSDRLKSRLENLREKQTS